MDYKYLWECIPIGKENAATYEYLCHIWNCDKRKARAILHQLSTYDNKDNLILIRSSKGRGFYRTDNIVDIENYIKECTNRAKSIFVTLKKARRVLKECEVRNEA